VEDPLDALHLELSEVEAALRRLDEGTYGRCEACGGPIPDEVLAANPLARLDGGH
jgi:DnaK suppressor protein